jgi:RNA polymerase sigma factor (sigma-70 family)
MAESPAMLIDAAAPPAPEAPPVDGAALLAAHLPEIDRALAYVVRQRHLSADAARGLASDVYLRLLQHDAAVLRSYRGESRLATFLVVVIQRVLLDTHIAQAGKWRPSASARRLGRVAILLERLVFHEGLGLQEAGALVRERLGVTDTDDELHFLLMLVPARCRRRRVGERELEQLRAAAPNPEEQLLQAAAAQAERRQVTAALVRLPDEDRRLIGLRFVCGLRLREIARRRGLDEKQIYRRFERALRAIRAQLPPAD